MEPGDTYQGYPPHDQRPGDQRSQDQRNQDQRNQGQRSQDQRGRPPAQQQPRPRLRPLVLTRDDLDLRDPADDDGTDDHRRGKVSSKRSRRWQHVDYNISKAFNRVARAAEHGTSEYIDARDRSEDDRKDGAILDIYENVARGLSKAVSEASPALVDVARAYNTRENRRSLRKVLDRLPRLPVIG